MLETLMLTLSKTLNKNNLIMSAKTVDKINEIAYFVYTQNGDKTIMLGNAHSLFLLNKFALRRAAQRSYSKINWSCLSWKGDGKITEAEIVIKKKKILGGDGAPFGATWERFKPSSYLFLIK